MKMTTGFANTHFIGSAFLTALNVIDSCRNLFLLWHQTRASQPSLNAALPLPPSCFALKSSFCFLGGGGPPAEVEAVALLAALCLTPPGGTCSENLTVLRL